MKVIEIIKGSASLLGLEIECAVLDAKEFKDEVQVRAEYPNIASLFNLLKFSIKELCANYAPMVASVIVQTMNKKISVSNFENFIRLKSVTKAGEAVKFKIINGCAEVEEDGEYEVSYLTYPIVESFESDVCFLENLSPDVIILGLCAYYALAHGMFDEFENMHEKYIEKAESFKGLKIFEMPARRWE